MKQFIGLTTLVVREYDEAIEFYVERLGFELICDEDQGGGKRWVVVKPTSAREGGVLLAQADGAAQSAAIGNQTGGRVGFFLYTDDFWRDYAAFRARGVKFVREEPRVEAYGTVAVFEDLYGTLWDLIEPLEVKKKGA